MAYTKFTGWKNTTLPVKMRSALANMEEGISQGISDADAAKKVADAALPKAGGTMSGAINMNSKKITNLATPTEAADAANKSYVDAGDDAATDAATKAAAAADAAKKIAEAALPKAGGTMTGPINMGSKQITNMAAPTADAHAATKKYVDDAAAGVASQLGSYLPTAGGSMSGPIDMNSNKITEVPTPQADTDAANKKYVDDSVGPVSTVANSAASTASAANTAATNAQNDINSHKENTAIHVAFTTNNPKMNGPAASGVATTVSRSDHVHPIDNSRAPMSHASTSTTYGAASASNYGHAKASKTSPKMNGKAAVGSEASSFARGDHVHPTDTSRQATIKGAATTITSSNLTESRALISNSSGKVAVSDVTSTELGYLDGVTSSIQTQLNTLSSKIANLESEVSIIAMTTDEIDTICGTII